MKTGVNGTEYTAPPEILQAGRQWMAQRSKDPFHPENLAEELIRLGVPKTAPLMSIDAPGPGTKPPKHVMVAEVLARSMVEAEVRSGNLTYVAYSRLLLWRTRR